VHHLYAMEVVHRRLFLWSWGCWQGGPCDAASEQGCARATVLGHGSAGDVYALLIPVSRVRSEDNRH
jgi:hypothetical protein